MNTPNSNNITAVILAGGQGSRMGGRDKGLAPYQGRPLIAHVIDAIGSQLDAVVINANRNVDEYAGYGYPVISDSLSGFQGPLAGFLAAMEQVDTEYILTLPCDGPIVVAHYSQEMADEMARRNCDIVVASDGEWMQPVYALIPRSLKADLKAFLEEGERKIDRWYARHNTRQLVFDPASGFFTNINTLDELKQ